MQETRPSLRDRALRTATRLRSRGPAEILELAGGRASEWLRSHEELIMLVREASAATPSFRHDPELTFRPAAPADASLYAERIGTDSPATFRRRLTRDTHCFLVERGDELLHASWVTTSAAWTREIRAYVLPPAGDAYVYESFTAPAARGRGVYPFALRGISSWATSGGVERVWVAVESANAPSLKAITKAGFEPSYSMRYGRRFGRLTLTIEKAPGVSTPEVSPRLPG